MSIYHDYYSKSDKYRMSYTPPDNMEQLVALRDLLQKAINNEDAKAETLREIISLLKKEGDGRGDSEAKTMTQTNPMVKAIKNSSGIVDTYRKLLALVNYRIAKLAPLRVVTESDEDDTLDQIEQMLHEPVEPVGAKMTMDLIDKAIENAERAAALCRELHASFLHHYTWRTGPWWAGDKRRYPRTDQKLIKKHRYDEIIRKIRHWNDLMTRRIELLRNLKAAVGKQ